MNIRCFLTLLLFMGAICCTVQATTTISITVTDETDNLPVSGASIYIAGSYVGTTNTNGYFEYTHSFSSSYRIGIKKTGYEYWSTQVSSGKTSLDAEMTPEVGTLTINILDSESLEPLDDALVTITGDNIDETRSTDNYGTVDFKVSLDSSYIITVKLNSYETLTKNVEINDESKTVDYLLQRNDLVIFQIFDGESDTANTPLADAEIYIDGKLAGETGSSGKVTLNIEHEKTYNVEVKRSQYASFEEEHFFSNDEILYTVTLSKNLYPVTVSVYDDEKRPISDAEIYIDQNLYGVSDAYGRSGVTKISSGNHEFLVKKTGYNDYLVTENIDGSLDDIIVTLDYSKSAVKIIVQDKDNKLVSGAIVSANGNSLGITDNTGMITTELIGNADYNFYVTAEGYNEFSDTRQVPLGSTEMTLTFVLEKKFDFLLIGIIAVAILILGFVVYNLKFRNGGTRGRNQKRPPRRYDGGGL
ncbi:MAG: carboxypeptidase regulatory-like domain-containing protein [Methanomicrobium sp.]|nr:carboxypeptidase regulatory-like domain-containing protein [Methanomicrobium sp.]